MTLKVDNIHLGYDGHAVVSGLSFSLAQGEIGCLLGESGCGKTTALRAIAGFEPLLAGAIYIEERLVSDASLAVPPEKRNTGMVFQDHALFPHLTVAQNIGFGIHRLAARKRREAIHELLALVGLDGLSDRFPHELSGGQQQRVALARALAPGPAILLLDEPFSNLDAVLRRQMGSEVREILKKRGTTALLVTHDQTEAFVLADRVGLMRSGRLLQWDTPYQLYHRPADRYVAAFTGRGSYLPARVNNGELVHALGRSPLPGGPVADNGEFELLIRPDDIQLDPSGLAAQVTAKEFQGAETFYLLRLAGGEQIGALFPSHENFESGQTIGIALDAKHLVTFSMASTP